MLHYFKNKFFGLFAVLFFCMALPSLAGAGVTVMGVGERGMNFGAGLHYSLYGANLVVDYTMRNQSDSFNTSNVFSLGIVF